MLNYWWEWKSEVGGRKSDASNTNTGLFPDLNFRGHQFQNNKD
jgi:hypothetical protein